MLGRLISTFGVAAVRGEIAAAVRGAKLRIILTAISSVLWLLAAGFAVAALTIWLAHVVGSVGATLILAAAFAVIAVALQIAVRLTKHNRPSLTGSLSGLMAPFKAAAADAEAVVGNPTAPPGIGGEAGPTGALLILATIGYLLGRYVKKR
jgi:hypothetical protein